MPPGASTLTLLHIDDDSAVRLLLQELVEEGRHASRDSLRIRWLEASGVEDAVRDFALERPDGVLLDNRLGPDDGIDLLPLVRQTWDCPVWILSGLAGDELAARGAQSGAAGVISKDQMLESPETFRSRLLAWLGTPPGG